MAQTPIRITIDQKRATLRAMKRRLKTRVANGYHTWDDMNARKAVKALEEEIRILKSTMKAETLKLLMDIDAGNKHTLANHIIAPLVSSNLVEVVEYRPNGIQFKKLKLSPWGKTYVEFENRRHEDKSV